MKLISLFIGTELLVFNNNPFSYELFFVMNSLDATIEEMHKMRLKNVQSISRPGNAVSFSMRLIPWKKSPSSSIFANTYSLPHSIIQHILEGVTTSSRVAFKEKASEISSWQN
jgi:hypothetical protein